ncbi:MAG: dockerin type I domain-containing protein [Planctomycetota bacterium]|nr:dockerin type I domain-containing protein [Planctomycetota bacterium]
MKPGPGYKAWHCIYLCVLVLLAPTAGLSIILHEGGEPNLLTWADKPANAVVGKWSTNASFVVVSPKWVLTTRHQGTSPATVDINGVTYNCIYNSQWTGGTAGNADIRLIRLKNTDGSDPNLAYAAPYTTTDEISNPIVIGGYGRGREITLYGGFRDNTPYGYTWGTGANYNNNTQRWCTNIIDGNDVAFDGIRTSEVITARFNDPGATQYEGIPAEYDSGGGWFIKVGTAWAVVGLTRGVEWHGDSLAVAESWYRNPNLQQDPDRMDAVRISSYAAWIQTITSTDCNGPGQGDLNGDCKVNMLDFPEFANQWLRTDCGSENKFCNGADFQPDGDVDIIDFALFAQNWLVDKSL